MYTAEKIKKLRIRLGYTQQQFARMVGVGIATVNRWERGHTSPKPDSITKLQRLEERGR